MAILSAIRQNTEVESKAPESQSQMVLPPSQTQSQALSVSEAEYLGVKKKPLATTKKKGFFESFRYGVDRESGEKSTGAGLVGDIAGSIVRAPTDSIIQASQNLWGEKTKKTREELDKLRLVNPELAAQIEYDWGVGEKRSTFRNVTQLGAGIGEGILTLVPIGLLGKAGRAAFTAKEVALMSKFGKPGQAVIRGLEPGASFSSKALNIGATGGAYGGLYGFLAGLQDGGDFEQAFKNVPMYSAMGATFGIGGLGAISLTGKAASGTFRAIKNTGSFLSKNTPSAVNPVTYFNKLPSSVQRAILTEGAYLKGKFGDVGETVVSKFNNARQVMNKEIGLFQDEAARLGMIDAPASARGAYKDSKAFRQKWKTDRDFRFAVRDALNHEGIFADPAVRKAALEGDDHMREIVEFFDKYRKDRGLLAQQMGITDNLLDIEKYFSKYTPEIGLSSKTVKRLESVSDNIEAEAIYRMNSDVVDDMVEYGFRRGQWKSKLEGFRSYYDAMDAALNLGRVGDENNAYFQWLVSNGYANSLAQARKMFIGSLDAPSRPLTQRAASLDYERKVPMPWSDPDPMRVMSYYVKKSDERIAMAAEFGVNDEILIDMQKAIAASNAGKSAADDFEKVIRTITGQVARAPAEQRFSAMVRAIETFHLAFSQIINVSTQVNYLLSSDMKHWAHGFKKAFEKEGMIESVRKGVFVSDMIRQTSPYTNLGDSVVDKFLTYSGFSYTEMINRATGVGVSRSWAEYNLNRALTKMAKNVLPEDAATSLNMLKDKKAAEGLILRRGYDNTGKYAREFAAKFPDEDFAPVAGNIGLAQKRLDKLESSISPKIKKLQNTKSFLQKKMVDEGKALTDENVMDLQESINILRESVDAYTGGRVRTVVDGDGFSDEQVKEAIDGVVKLRRSKMEKMIEQLEEQFDEARAVGQLEPVVTPSAKPLTKEQRLAKYNEQIKDIDEAIISLTNEIADKERLLGGIIDGYKIAEKEIRKEFPQGFVYDDFIAQNKSKLGELPSEEAAYLRELGIDPEEALARGAISEDEFVTAAQIMVESTHGGNNPLIMPGMSRSPMGKIFYQFKSFAYMQAQFIQREFVRSMVAKDTRGLYNAMKFITVVGGIYPLTYGALRDIRDIVTLKKRPEDAFELDEYFKGLGMVSAGGLFVDFMKSAQSGRSMEFLAGPTIGDVTRYLDAIGDLTEFDKAGWKKLARQLMNQTGVGNIINNTLLK